MDGGWGLGDWETRGLGVGAEIYPPHPAGTPPRRGFSELGKDR